METVKNLLLILHIAAGFTGLSSGLLPMLSKKGSRLHVTSGLVFYYAMVAATLSGIALAFIVHSTFLFLIGAFSFYLVFNGRMFIRKKAGQPIIFTNLEWGITLGTGLVALSMVWQGGSQLLAGNSGGLILLIFGSATLFSVVRGISIGMRCPVLTASNRLAGHIGFMGGGYIAAATAFLVVNNWIDNPLIGWLLPTAIGTPLISWAIASVKRKAARAKAATA